ncbi:FUSC family protein [Candidatus Dormiibacter inghamiae]|uniref:FUSC family protein n=1 Tax=Candidatus Dormiibacter inghamiae TaxID=3127013 RepID=UPI0030C6FF25
MPEVVIEFTPWRADAALIIAGMLPALIGWTYAPRYALASIPVSAVLNALAMVVFGHPIITTLLMVLIAVMVGISALRSLHAVATFAAIQPAIAAISGPPTVSFSGTTPGLAGQALVGAGVVVIGGLWAVLIGAMLLRNRSSGAPAPVPAPIVASYTGTLVLLLGAAAFVASTWFSGTTAGWVLLTILLVARPTYAESRFMIAERTVGTIVGAALAAVLAMIVSNRAMVVLMGTVAMVVAAVLHLQHARYGYFTVFVTAAVVLLNASGGNVFTLGLQRVLYTMVGVGLVAVVVAVSETVLGRSTTASV